ncbi:hypothetical protein GTA08_BOTSDO13655 [Botryosphaeria dothidea]|uniref:Uncharacterized protein n=1 Tax=Botryosphaeria dothidea TaxID=55169 RepID=A0A8H4J0U7_9PEZI|nr:hypothetical protein GTA08_BOTSDO13655 [Botryosphaeria dothidea]
MEIFGPDLLYCILIELQATHRPSIFTATLVSKDWHAVAQRIIDSRIDPLIISPGSEARCAKIFQRLQDNGFCKRVHRICVKELYASGTMPEMAALPNHPLAGQRAAGEYGLLDRRSAVTWAQLDRLTELIPTLPSLSNFEWSAKARIPPCILAALSQRPSCSIHIHLREKPSSTKSITFAALETPASLSSLHLVVPQLVTLSTIIPATNSAMLLDLGNLIAASSRTLRSLAIHAAGRIRPVSAEPYTAVTNFSWLTGALTTPLRLRNLTLLNFCACEAEHGNPLANVIGEGDLHSIHLTCPAVLKLMPESAQARRLKLRLDSGRVRRCAREHPDLRAVRSFLVGQRALKALEVLNGVGIMHSGPFEGPRELLEHLGKTLEVLEVGDEDTWPEGRQTRAVEGVVLGRADMLSLLGNCCTRLKDVGIGMPRADADFDASLQSVKQHLRAVHRLHLFVEAEKPGDGRFRSAMTLDRAVSVWHILRAEPRPMRMLERLIIEVGPPVSLDRSGSRIEDMHLSKLWRKYRVEFRHGPGKSGTVACLQQIEEAEES